MLRHALEIRLGKPVLKVNLTRWKINELPACGFGCFSNGATPFVRGERAKAGSFFLRRAEGRWFSARA